MKNNIKYPLMYNNILPNDFNVLINFLKKNQYLLKIKMLKKI